MIKLLLLLLVSSSEAGQLISNGHTDTISGNAGTATALSANGANCSAGAFPLGVDASGAAETCSSTLTGSSTLNVLKTGDTMTGSLLIKAGGAADDPIVAGTQLQVSNAGAAYLEVTDATNNVNVIGVAATGGGTFGTYSNNTMQYKTNNTTALTMDTSQRIGIGTLTPGVLLHISSGAVTIDGTGAAFNVASTFSVTGANGSYVSIGAAAVDGTHLNINMNQTGGGTKTNHYGIYINESGGAQGTYTNNYGIRINSLDTSAASNAAYGLYIGPVYGTLKYGIYQDQAATTNINAFAGDTGIGTDNPLTKLEVNGSAQFGSGVTKSTFSTTGSLTLASAATLTIGGGTAIVKIQKLATSSTDLGGATTATCTAETNFSMTGVAVGDACTVSVPAALAATDWIVCRTLVDNVALKYCTQGASVDPAAMVFHITTIEY